MVTVVSASASHFASLILKCIIILRFSLLQNSSPVSSEDSNSLFSEVCPHIFHLLNMYTPLSLRLCVTHLLALFLQVMAAAVHGAVCSAVQSALLRVGPRWQRAGIVRSDLSLPSDANRCWGRRTRVSLPVWRGEVAQARPKASSGRVCGHGIQKKHHVLNSDFLKIFKHAFTFDSHFSFYVLIT